MTKEQLCWTCHNACGDCSWSSCFQPVEGWTAEKVHRKTYDSYRIEKCPEYVKEENKLKRKKKARITNEDLAEMKKLRDSGMGIWDIAEYFDREPCVVRKALLTRGN